MSILQYRILIEENLKLKVEMPQSKFINLLNQILDLQFLRMMNRFETTIILIETLLLKDDL